jgi:NADH-quinone oxidoreductase subunit I
MQPLTNRVKEVDRKPMTLGEKIYLPAVLRGMSITFKHMFKKRPTIDYPEKNKTF